MTCGPVEQMSVYEEEEERRRKAREGPPPPLRPKPWALAKTRRLKRDGSL